MTDDSVTAGLAREQIALDHTSRTRLFRNVVVLAGSQIVTWTMSIAWTLFIPRVLGPASMGLLVLNWSAAGVITVLAGLGTKLLLVREIAADGSQAPRLLGAAFYLRALLLVPALGVTLLYVRLGGFDQQRSLFILLAYAGTVVVLFTEPIQAAFQGLERMEYLALGDVLIKTCGAMGAIVLVFLGHGALSLVVLALVLSWTVLLLYMGLIRRYVRVDLRFAWPSIVWLFRQSLVFWAFGVFFTIYLWIDSVILAVMAPPEVLGWYGVPTKLFGTLMFVPTILCTAWLPRLAFAHRQSQQAFSAALQPLLEIVITLSLPIGVGAALIASPLIALLYGASFAPSVPVLVILACTAIPTYINIVVNQVLVASHRQNRWILVMAGASIFNPVLNVVLIRIFQAHQHNGAIGAALALLVTELLIVAVGVCFIRRALTLHLALRLLRGLLATAGMAVSVLAVRRFGLGAELVAGTVTFAGLALLLGVVKLEEARDLRDLVRRRPRPAM